MNTDAIIFVVDSTDVERLETARAELAVRRERRGGEERGSMQRNTYDEVEERGSAFLGAVGHIILFERIVCGASPSI